MKSVYFVFVVIVSFLLLACASGDGGGRGGARSAKTFVLPDTDAGSTAHGAAYTGSAIFLRKPMPSHADWRPQEFYFKVCSQATAANYYSKTSYSCNEK